MQGAARRKEPTVCVCGALELDAAMEQARTYLAAQAARPATAGEASILDRLKMARFTLAGLPHVYPELQRSTVLHQTLGLIDATLSKHKEIDSGETLFDPIPTDAPATAGACTGLMIPGPLPEGWKTIHCDGCQPTPTYADVEAAKKAYEVGAARHVEHHRCERCVQAGVKEAQEREALGCQVCTALNETVWCRCTCHDQPVKLVHALRAR
jgi:hypothetical protein